MDRILYLISKIFLETSTDGLQRSQDFKAFAIVKEAMLWYKCFRYCGSRKQDDLRSGIMILQTKNVLIEYCKHMLKYETEYGKTDQQAKGRWNQIQKFLENQCNINCLMSITLLSFSFCKSLRQISVYSKFLGKYKVLVDSLNRFKDDMYVWFFIVGIYDIFGDELFIDLDLNVRLQIGFVCAQLYCWDKETNETVTNTITALLNERRIVQNSVSNNNIVKCMLMYESSEIGILKQIKTGLTQVRDKLLEYVTNSYQYKQLMKDEIKLMSEMPSNTDNIESSIGIFSYYINKFPTVRTSTTCIKVLTKRNHTFDYIDNLKVKDKQKILNYVFKESVKKQYQQQSHKDKQNIVKRSLYLQNQIKKKICKKNNALPEQNELPQTMNKLNVTSKQEFKDMLDSMEGTGEKRQYCINILNYKNIPFSNRKNKKLQDWRSLKNIVLKSLK